MNGDELDGAQLDDDRGAADDGDVCDRCGTWLFDDFVVLVVHYPGGSHLDKAVCYGCYGEMERAFYVLDEYGRPALGPAWPLRVRKERP